MESPPEPAAAPSGPTDTQGRLLDEAERLFAEHGYEATSLRAVTGAAGANLAAVHYHFGSKSGLFLAVLRRRVVPINRTRLARLDALVERGDPRLADVLDAFVRPVVEIARGPGGEHFARVVGRIVGEPGEHAAAIRAEFEEVRARFLPVLVRLVPGLSPAELGLRMQMTLGALSALLSRSGELTRVCDEAAIEDPARLADELVRFTAAGLAAPATGGDAR